MTLFARFEISRPLSLVGFFLLSLLLGVGLFARDAGASARHPFFAKNPEKEKRLDELLQGAGLRPVQMQPADLSLQLVDTEKDRFYALSRHRGQVLLVTRWATWCGACKSELPSKQALWKTMEKERFAMIGISNEDRDTIRSYAKTGPSYPISLMDPQDVFSRFFPGGGIPVTLLIDGWGWILGLRQGGGAWDTPAVAALLRFLLSIAPDAKRLLPSVPPPKVTFSPVLRASVGEVIPLRFSLRWVGEADKYARLLFRLPKHPAIEEKGLQTSGIATDDQGNQRDYILPLSISKPGRYEIKPLLLTYWIKDYDEHFQTEIGSLTFEIAGSPLASVTSKASLFALLFGCLVFLGLFVFFAKRGKPNA